MHKITVFHPVIMESEGECSLIISIADFLPGECAGPKLTLFNNEMQISIASPSPNMREALEKYNHLTLMETDEHGKPINQALFNYIVIPELITGIHEPPYDY